jgi:small-conductance mechanosensitive channel
VSDDSSAVDRVQEAARPVGDLLDGARRLMPRLAVAAVLIVLAGFAARIVRPLLHRMLHGWERADAATAIIVLMLWILALGAAISVIAGDMRALVGSVGLFGLALSWSLQTPIESFTGWLLNSFRGYYRVGDRIAVGDVFGDVYAIDILTTTVWEAGGAGKPVAAAQPTGALITFPNSEILRSNIVNYTRDFPYVWDEVTLGLANETDLPHAIALFRETANRLLAAEITGPAEAYRVILRAKDLDYDVDLEPQVFVVVRDAWTDLIVRYLVPARQRRKWSSELTLALTAAINLPEHRSRVIPAYPRQQIELLEPERKPAG